MSVSVADFKVGDKFVTQKSKAEGLEGSGTTEDECRKILGRFGYNFDKIGHVLLATPI